MIIFTLMNFKYIKNISEGGEAVILLHGEIGNTYNKAGEVVKYGINGANFAHEMQYLQDKASTIRVSINSIGGSVLDGYSIVSAILDSKVKTITSIDGLAASIAGVIAMMGNKVEMKDYGTLMMHNVSGGADKQVMALMEASLVTIFNNRTELEAEQVSKMMDSETWMNAQQAMDSGMIDSIISSAQGKHKKEVTQAKNLNDLVLIYNKVNQTPKTNKMELVNKSLGLDSAAAEMDAVNSITDLNESNKDLESKLEASEAKVLELENAAKEAAEAKLEAETAEKLEKATELVNSYGAKVKEENKEATIKLALVDLEGVKNMLDSIGKAVKISDKITNKSGKAGAAVNSERATWTLRDWEQKDEKGLKNIQNNSPEIYSEMYFEKYGVEYKA